MADPFLGQLKIFGGSYAPAGWMFCQGQVLQISAYDALYNLLGTAFGGDGVTTFALPDLRGRVPPFDGAGITGAKRRTGSEEWNDGTFLERGSNERIGWFKGHQLFSGAKAEPA